MSEADEMIGKRFGRWTVERFSHQPLTSAAYFLCRCDCGRDRAVLISSLIAGKSQSCGCMRVEHATSKATKHGLSHLPEYKVWNGMITRCQNPNYTEFQNYGGRGIKVCPEWQGSPEKFIEWARRNGYREGLQLDRRDVDGDYEPSNCRFVTPKVNVRNRRCTRRLTAFGENKTLQEWIEDVRCVAPKALQSRLRDGWDIEKAISTPIVSPERMVEAFGETKSILEWSKDPRCLVTECSLRERLRKGWDAESAMKVERMDFKQNLRSVRRMIQAFGTEKSIADWSRDPRCQISKKALQKRLTTGWNPEEAITTGSLRS
jgi:hypothetical protein